MKRFFKFAVLSLVAAAFCACDDDIDFTDPGLEVTPNNIAGTWQLAEWNHAPLAEGSYVYIDFIRRDRKFKMYQNIDSFSARRLTGEFYIYTEEKTGSVIRGVYDYTLGKEWNHRYIVTDLTETRMVWTAKDDPEDISVYVRAEIPADITAGFEDEEKE